jgi:hypothetical protein
MANAHLCNPGLTGYYLCRALPEISIPLWCLILSYSHLILSYFKEEEERLVEGKDTDNSSTIPITVEKHRVTTESIATNETNETIFDDVEVPGDKEKSELNLQINSLKGKVVELTSKLREKEMEVQKMLFLR